MPSFAEHPFQKFQDLNDDTIVSGENLIRAIQEFESKVKVIKTETGDAFVYAVESNDKDVKTFKIIIGRLEIDVAINLKTLVIVIEVYMYFPLIGKLQIAKTAGNLRDGVTLPITLPPVVKGSLTLTLDGKDLVVEYCADVHGRHYEGRIVITIL